MSAHRPSRALDALCREVDRLGRREVRLTLWDAYLRAEADGPEVLVLRARDAARTELERLAAGRFPSLALAVGDAVLTARRGAARAATRAFALAVAGMSLGELHALAEDELCRRTFACDVRAGMERRYASREGRLGTVRGAARVLMANAAVTPALARRALLAPGWRRGIGASLLTVGGMGAARVAKLRRNVGIVEFAPDAEVRARLAPLLELPSDATAAQLERRLARVERVLGMTPFEVERVVRFTLAAPVARRGSRRAA
jgi:hypothetical protein